MAHYRSLLLGCGPRAVEHVVVYADIPNMEMVACCDLQKERTDRFQQDFAIPEAFDDYETALEQIQPDVVHICTSPGNRIWEVEVTARAGVKAAIIEKPVAIKPSEVDAIEEICDRTGLKVIVNCQRRYFPQFRDGVIRDIVANKLGEVYFVRASTKGNTMGMGPHTMDLLLMFLGEAMPESVWAMAQDISEESYEASHKAPQSIFAEYWFPGGIRAFFDCSPEALGTPGEESFWMHLHFDFLGSEGRLYLTQNNGYWYQKNGSAEVISGESSWDNQGFEGQRDFTAAVADWLDGGAPHLNRYELHKNVVRALLGAQQSVYMGHRIDFPLAFTDEQWIALHERVRDTMLLREARQGNG